MKRFLLSLVIVGIGAVFSIPEAHARQCCGGQGQAWRQYDRATVETRKGTVVDIKTYDRGGIHVTLKADKGSIDVHLGPAFYLDKKVTIAKGDVISVTGSRVTYDGVAAIIAREVEKGGVKVQLRKDDGTPLWAGQGRWHR
ncbi:MAG TPA: DNA-binding protein [Spirochaetota bacterium]|nr:DNA-binding protein [Spirochaetota bacterium]HPC40840.1 DNA-binding protein [Spirochaetota bacterium]HPL17455.1 DNA-binding protein [Spirochaetota bacterium]HQF07770.1 DNA-binding protein [Spirochaetota bacterium]HQH96823.1 DNA-binding protein [Spirochaetota bacterium]